MDSIEKADSFDVICLWGFSQEEVKFLEGKTLIFFTSEFGGNACYQVYYDGDVCDLEQFQAICEEMVFQSFCYLIHQNLPEKEKKMAEKWIYRCQMIEWQVQLSASDYQDFGVKVFQNLYETKKRSFDGQSFYLMKNIFQNVPAVICGAGPSLEEKMSYLKQVENRGIIFAGGAALGLLGEGSVPIHIAAGIDPDPCYEKVLMQNAFEAPFFYQSRFSSSILQTVQGSLFQVPSNPGYPLESWLREGECFDGGWTVSTFCAAMAIYFGCNPIIFVGVDLSDGIEEGKECLKTQKDWILAGKWLEDLIAKNQDRSFYTTSEKGLFIEGLKKVSFSELFKENFLKQLDTNGLVHLLKSFWSPFDIYDDKMVQIEKSLEKSLGYIDTLLHLFEKFYPKDPTEKGEFALNLLELQEEIAYQKILDPVWNIWQYPLYRQFKDSYARQVNQMIFFKKVLQEYRMCVCK
ncbi:MAG: DUF115 domain-containing protein [Verrucomicrobia bacterium]|nr:DUF115 domain-containing protein [Verrucomicrobiota bacterium]